MRVSVNGSRTAENSPLCKIPELRATVIVKDSLECKTDGFDLVLQLGFFHPLIEPHFN